MGRRAGPRGEMFADAPAYGGLTDGFGARLWIQTASFAEAKAKHAPMIIENGTIRSAFRPEAESMTAGVKASAFWVRNEKVQA